MGPNERLAIQQNNWFLIGFTGFIVLVMIALHDRRDLAEQLDSTRKRNQELLSTTQKHRRELDGALETIHRLQRRGEPERSGPIYDDVGGRVPKPYEPPNRAEEEEDDGYGGTDD